jgi:hypothetical protein
MIEEDALDDPELDAYAVGVLLRLLQRADWTDAMTNRSERAIAEAVGCNRRTVRRALERLARCGYVDMVEPAATKRSAVWRVTHRPPDEPVDSPVDNDGIGALSTRNDGGPIGAPDGGIGAPDGGIGALSAHDLDLQEDQEGLQQRSTDQGARSAPAARRVAELRAERRACLDRHDATVGRIEAKRDAGELTDAGARTQIDRYGETTAEEVARIDAELAELTRSR